MSEISLPVHAPERYADRQTLWTEVEYKEKHPRAQLAYSFDIALQNELSMEENIALAREFIQTNFVARGMICDWAVHNGADKNSATELGKLMHDFFCTDPNDMHYKQLADKVRYFKEDEKGVAAIFLRKYDKINLNFGERS